MKNTILPLLLSLYSLGVSAQPLSTVTAPPERNNEIGLFAQSKTSSNESYLGLGGVQFKHWRNEHLGFRVIAAVGQYHDNGQQTRYVVNDTLFTTQQSININLPVLGAGLEAQRHFYKNVWLFAAAELKGGYGAGKANGILTKATGTIMPGSETFERFGSRDANLFYIGATASIGAKLRYSRLTVGLELIPVQMSYSRLSGSLNQNGGITDFSMGTFSQRISLGWRFR